MRSRNLLRDEIHDTSGSNNDGDDDDEEDDDEGEEGEEEEAEVRFNATPQRKTFSNRR